MHFEAHAKRVALRMEKIAARRGKPECEWAIPIGRCELCDLAEQNATLGGSPFGKKRKSSP